MTIKIQICQHNEEKFAITGYNTKKEEQVFSYDVDAPFEQAQEMAHTLAKAWSYKNKVTLNLDVVDLTTRPSKGQKEYKVGDMLLVKETVMNEVFRYLICSMVKNSGIEYSFLNVDSGRMVFMTHDNAQGLVEQLSQLPYYEIIEHISREDKIVCKKL